MLFLLYSFWIPQIVHNITADVRKPLHPLYVCGVTFTRLLIPLYLYGCPHNFMRIEPNYLYLWTLVGFASLQVRTMPLHIRKKSVYCIVVLMPLWI